MRKFSAVFPGPLAANVPDALRSLRPEKLVGPEVLDVKKRIVRGAAEMLWQHRAVLHQHGLLYLELPKRGELPLWMAMVLEVLRERPRSWQVEELRPEPSLNLEKGGKRYVVRWRGWLKNAKGRRK